MYGGARVWRGRPYAYRGARVWRGRPYAYGGWRGRRWYRPRFWGWRAPYYGYGYGGRCRWVRRCW